MDAQGWKFQLTEKTNEITRRKHTRGTNKIIIVGHPLSGFEHVTQLLADSGMTPALPTLREGLSPQNVTSQICSAHGIPPLDEWQMDHQDEIRQLEVSPIWHGLVLDVIRGNMNQPLWGWADPSAVFLLNFWKSVTPDITFVLVYNHPRSALNVHKTENADDIREEYQSPERVLDYWKKYNEALLQFYQRNASQCLLVHAEQLQRNPFGMLDGINAVSGSELIRTNDDIGLEDSTQDTHFSLNRSSVPPEPINLSRFAKRKAHTSIIPQDAAENPLEVFLAEKLLDHYPDAKDLYEELQAVATVPFHKKTSVEVGINMVWHAFQDLLNTNAHLSTENLTFKTKVDDLIKEHTNVQIALEAKQLVNDRLLKQSSELREELNHTQFERNRIAQRVLELENQQKLSLANAEELKSLRAQIAKRSDDIIQKELVLSQLKSEWQQVEKNQQQDIDLLTRELHSIQEQLGRLYADIAKNKSHTSEVVNQYEKQLTEVNKNRTIQTRNQIQLENDLKDKSQKLIQATKELKILEKRLDEERTVLAQRSIELTQIQTCFSESESALNKRNSDLTLIKSQLVRATESNVVKQERINALTKEIGTLKANQKPRFIGAKERQQKELVYRIGYELISLSQSFAKWKLLFYPIFIRKFLSRFATEITPMNEWQPPITEYEDYEEAVKARKHLSFQLGAAWQECQGRRWSNVVAPWILLRTYKMWKASIDG